MRIAVTPSAAAAFAAASLALLASACSGGPPAETAPPAGERSAAHGHPESFDAAKALAAGNRTPLLVDFYSPT